MTRKTNPAARYCAPLAYAYSCDGQVVVARTPAELARLAATIPTRGVTDRFMRVITPRGLRTLDSCEFLEFLLTLGEELHSSDP
jgi:hypothetical protein